MDKKSVKKVLLVLFILAFIALVSTLYIIHLNSMYKIPDDCNYICLRNGCAKIEPDGTIIWTEGSDHLPISDDYYEMGRLEDILSGLKLSKADVLPTDVQLIDITFEHRTWVEPQTVLDSIKFAFDFYTEKFYVHKDNVWYIMEKNDDLNAVIVSSLSSRGIPIRGESTFCLEEFPDSDFENATFRYNVYWSAFYDEHFLAGIKNSGFNNVDEVTITSREEAIVRAAKELGYDNPVAVTFYDETCNYYKVEIANDNGNGIMQDTGSMIEFVEPIYSVVIDDMGRTLEVYQGYTRTRPFWPKASS